MHSPSPLTKIIFIQRCAKFSCRTPKKVVKLCFVNKDFRETILDYSIELLLLPLLKCTTTTNAEAKQNSSKNWKSFRRILSILFKHVSLSNLEILQRLLKFNYKFLLKHPDFQSLKPTIARVELLWQYFLSAVENSKLGVDKILDLFRMSDDTENEKKSNADRLVLPVKIRPSNNNSISERIPILASQLRQLVELAARAGNHEMLKTLLDSNNPLFFGKFIDLVHKNREKVAWPHEDGSVSFSKDNDYTIDMSMHRMFYYGFQNAVECGSVSCFKTLVEARNKIVDMSLTKSTAFRTVLFNKKHFSAQNMQHPFCRAVELNHVDIVRYAVEEFNQRPFDHFSSTGDTIFCHALQQGSVDVVEFFLDWYFENVTRKLFTNSTTRTSSAEESSSNKNNVVFKPLFRSLRRRELEAMPDKLPRSSRRAPNCYDNPFHMIARMKAKRLTKHPNVFVIPSGGNNRNLYPHERLGNNNKNNNTLVELENEIVNDVAIRMAKLLVAFMKKEQEVYKHRPGMNEHFLAFQYDVKTLLLHQGTKFQNTPLQLAVTIDGGGEGNNKKFVAFFKELVESQK